MFLNKSKFILWIAFFFFSCEKGVIITDPVAPKLTFDKLSKNYTAGGQYTTAEILANVKGNKTGYTLKEITNLEPNDVVTVNGSSPTPFFDYSKNRGIYGNAYFRAQRKTRCHHFKSTI